MAITPGSRRFSRRGSRRAATQYTDLGTTVLQDSGTWVYKGEWNGTLNRTLYAEARYGVFGYYLPLLPNTDTTLPQRLDSVRLTIDGGDATSQTNRQRRR